MAPTSANPLKFSSLKNNAIDFPSIHPEQYLPALKSAIDVAKKNIASLRDSKEEPTFENTIAALESASEESDLISTIFFNQLTAHTSDALQSLAKEVGPLISSFSSDVALDEKLFARVKAVYSKYFSTETNQPLPGMESETSIGQERLKLLEKNYSDFVRNGALLDSDKKEQLRKIDVELSTLGPNFSENVLKATNEFQLVLTKRDELAGLPPSAIEAAANAAKEKGLQSDAGEGPWLFTLHGPSYLAFMTYSSNRPARQTLWTAAGSRAFRDKFDNQPILKAIVELRQKRAQLLGYETHADFVLEKRMAETPEKVYQFLDQLKGPAVKKAKEDVRQVEDFARKDGLIGPLMPWDFSYYSEKLKEELFKFSGEELRPYFKLENVIEGVFEHARRLYDLEFRAADGQYPVYHPDVRVFEVYDSSTKEFMALFYADFFPRESKSGGAWMTNYLEQGHYRGEVRRPHVAIVCNFTKPTEDKPSLLTHDEVLTLFHEFGHALHSLLSKVHHRTLSGTNVYWDFVELPSQVMENWAYEKESLDLFARHYVTGEPIPQALAEKVKASSLYLSGYLAVRQLTFGYMDMKWHTAPISQIQDVDKFEEEATRELRIFPKVDGTNSSCSFSHIFAGGYSAGYYSYKWAEVLDADTFELFEEKGLFDKTAARAFRDNILSRGGTEHPMLLYKKFRGREPDPKALLRRDGLI